MRVLLVGTWGEREDIRNNLICSNLAASDPQMRVHRLNFIGNSSPLPTGDFGINCLKSDRYLSLKLALSARHSPETIEYVARFLPTTQYASLRFIALKLLNRQDSSGTLRLLEREVFLQAAISSVMGQLLEIKPTVVVFSITPHEFFPYLTKAIASFLGCRVVDFQPCSIAPALIVKVDGQDCPAPRHFSVGEQVFAESVIRDAEIRLKCMESGEPPDYMKKQFLRDTIVSRPLARFRRIVWFARWMFRDRFSFGLDFSGIPSLNPLIRRFAALILTRTLQSELRKSSNELGNGEGGEVDLPYAVFALHYEPERTSLPDGLPIEFQADAILRVRALLPPSINLLIKEHYSQQTSALRGFLGRSPLFYELIKGLPKTSFARTGAKLTSLVRGAKCVFTLTGTIAIEAVLSDVPVAYFGEPWWAGLPGTHKITGNINVNDISIPNHPNRAGAIDFLLHKITDEMIPGAGAEVLQVVEKRFGTLSDGFPHAEAQAVSNVVTGLVRDADGNSSKFSNDFEAD